MEESWTILELAELAAEALTATDPTGPPAGAGSPASTGSAAGTGAPAGTGPASAGSSVGAGPASAGSAVSTGGPAGARSLRGAGSPAGSVRVNGRVRDVPNERLIRWYVTVGLVDPPLSRRGRVARYGRRHLLQLVAVKRRQAEGRSLAEIQAELAGATDEALAAVACVPDARPAPESLALVAPDRFWARPPAQRVLAAAERHGEQDLADAERHGEQDLADAERAGRPVAAARHGSLADRGRSRLVHGIRLAPEVTLLLEGADREPGPDDLTAIINAARPLLEELASRGLRADHLEWG
jgi:DNA-binding transcriptional MerR regulator